MEKQFITKSQQEKVNNRLVMNFGILLLGALVILYTYSFAISTYRFQLINVMEVLSIIFLAAGVAILVLGLKKYPKLTPYSAIPFGAFLPAVLIGYVDKIPFLRGKFMTVLSVEGILISTLILMGVYFIVLCIYTAVYLSKHPVEIQKKKIQHKKKK